MQKWLGTCMNGDLWEPNGACAHLLRGGFGRESGANRALSGGWGAGERLVCARKYDGNVSGSERIATGFASLLEQLRAGYRGLARC